MGSSSVHIQISFVAKSPTGSATCRHSVQMPRPTALICGALIAVCASAWQWLLPLQSGSALAVPGTVSAAASRAAPMTARDFFKSSPCISRGQAGKPFRGGHGTIEARKVISACRGGARAAMLGTSYEPSPGVAVSYSQPPHAMPEQVIWEGVSASLTSAATGGRVAPRYRLTTHHLYFERGLLKTDAQQVPIHEIVDIDVKQSLTQKARGVGDVIVHVQRPTGPEKVTLESVHDPRAVQQAINAAAHQARLREQHAARYPMPVQMVHTSQQPPAGGPGIDGDLVTQLERLGALVKSGILTREEFDAKKAEILRRL
ncbi:PH domain-containing protein [Spongiactinospora gelatinilytica]|nr:PH domain-containing protein [Spongiactinospora gelatinilytica]